MTHGLRPLATDDTCDSNENCSLSDRHEFQLFACADGCLKVFEYLKVGG